MRLVKSLNIINLILGGTLVILSLYFNSSTLLHLSIIPGILLAIGIYTSIIITLLNNHREEAILHRNEIINGLSRIISDL